MFELDFQGLQTFSGPMQAAKAFLTKVHEEDGVFRKWNIVVRVEGIESTAEEAGRGLRKVLHYPKTNHSTEDRGSWKDFVGHTAAGARVVIQSHNPSTAWTEAGLGVRGGLA